MSAPIVAIIPHRLGKTEASRRLREGLGRASSGFASLLNVSPATWEGDRVTFQVRALAQTATASIEVLEHELRLELTLPWFLEKLAYRIMPALRQQATLLLEKK
jgi:Putative polyhydroxyalkanoic acid system protein (PHA_gran_rgn)